jgi:AcrR family transcriptional regulator
VPAKSPKRLTRQERQAETRQRLLDAAAKAFIKHGFQGASVEEICAEAGYTRGAFYSNFETKEQMFVELLHQRVYDEYRSRVAELPTDVHPADAIRLGAEQLRERYSGPREDWIFALWLECLAHAARHPEFRSLAATFWSGTRQMAAAAISAGYEQIGREPPIEPKDIAAAFIAIDIGLVVQHMVDPDEVPLELYPRLYELLFVPLVE